MLEDDLGNRSGGGNFGINIGPGTLQYPDGNSYTMQNNSVRNNIFYRGGVGLRLESDWTGTTGNVIDGNVFAVGIAGDSHAAGVAVDSGSARNLSTAGQLTIQNNRFYAGTGVSLPSAAWMGAGNTIGPNTTAASAESWPDPDRTLKRYVIEVLGLTLLDWDDDPFLGGSTDPGTEYDPAGMKTFMAVATNMRNGGATPIPSAGKPSWTGDYPWDERFTAQAVVNWIRAGFGLAVVE